jgi:hypothetical protein
MRISRFAMLTVAVCLLAVAAGAVGAVASVRHGHQTSRQPRAHASAATYYSTLRAALAPAEAVPAGLAKGLPTSTVSKAHLLQTQVSRGRAWLAPSAAGGVCLIIEMGAASCQDDPAQAAQGTVEAVGGAGGGPDFKDGEVLIYGVVPDGVDTVRLTLKSGVSQTLAVAGNAFSADVMGPTEDVEYTDATGTAHRLPAPSYTG